MYASRSLGMVVAGALLAAASFSGGHADAQEGAFPLYQIVSPLKAHDKAESGLLRSATVALDPGLSRLHQKASGALLQFPTFSGAVQGRVAWSDGHSANAFSLAGALTGGASGTFVVTVNQGAAAMSIHDAARGWLRVSNSPAGYLLQQFDPEALPPCGSHQLPKLASASNGSPSPVAAIQKDGAPVQIDVLVVYTAASLAQAGSTAAMEALILNAAATANVAYTNSGIDLNITVVHMAEVTYVEDNETALALAKLTFPNDGVMDEVHLLRNTYDADMVSLIVYTGNVGGIGWILDSLDGNIAGQAFSITRYHSLGSLTFAHELGHNMGCAHDQDNITAEGYRLFSYSRGWRFYAADDGNRKRTVMSYAPGTRIPYFSNPDISYMGTATGVPPGSPDEAHNALTINTSAPHIAMNRPQIGEGEGEGDGEGTATPEGFYCEMLDGIYGNTLLRTLLPGFAGPLLDLLQPATADMNGTANPDTLTFLGNGMLDCAHELGVLRQVVETTTLDLSSTGGVTHLLAAQALTGNRAQLVSDIGATDATIVEGIAPGLLDLCAAYITLGDDGSTGFIAALLEVINEVQYVGTLNLAAYAKLPQYLAPDGDADGDGATNREEYEAYAAFGAETYVAFALNPTIFPGGEGEAEGSSLYKTESFLAAMGDDICFLISNAGSAGPGDFTWHFSPAQGSGTVLLPLEDGIELCLGNVQPTHEGAYTATFDNDAKTQAVYTAILTVTATTPSAGPLALVFGLILIAVASTRLARKKPRQSGRSNKT